MTVEQVGRTTNSITINVGGITEGDRQTWVWEPKTGEWYTLQAAEGYGYINGFDVANLDDNNGDITVYIPDEYADKYKVWAITVVNLVANKTDIGTLEEARTDNAWIYISTVIGFEYENEKYKKSGEKIDITVRDCLHLWYFGNYMSFWICENGEEIDYGILDCLYTSDTGDEIYADYLSAPARGILEAVEDSIDYVPNYVPVFANVNDVVDRCKSGADFEAQFFEEMRVAINNFNMSITV